MVRSFPGCLLVLLVAGCQEVSDPLDSPEPDACIAAWHLPSGAVRSAVGGMGEFQSSNGRFSRQGGLGISASDGNLSITVAATVEQAGGDIVRAVEERDFPVRAALGARSNDSGYALVYRDSDTFVSDDAATGWLHLSGLDGDDLVGCFALDVTALDRDEGLSWSRGLLHVPPL